MASQSYPKSKDGTTETLAAVTMLDLSSGLRHLRNWVLAADFDADGHLDLAMGPLEPANPAATPKASRVGIVFGGGQRVFSRILLIDMPIRSARLRRLLGT